MKNPQDMTNDKIIQWMDKTTTSMRNAWGSGQFRKATLVDRFEELKEEAVERNIWENWCENNYTSTEADGWDFFA